MRSFWSFFDESTICRSFFVVAEEDPEIKRLPGRDPSLRERFLPLTTNELIRRIEQSGHDVVERSLEEVSSHEEHENVLRQAVGIWEMEPQIEYRYQGRSIPEDFQTKLLSLLKHLRWTVPNDRPGLTAERYRP